MRDQEITELFWERKEQAVKAVSLRKGVPLMKKEDFLKLMDGIDDRLVEKYAISDEAEARQKQIRRQRRQRWLNQVTGCAVAAIILGVIGVAMLCASFGIVRMDRQSQKTPVSLGDGSDSQNNENNGDEEKELLLQAYLSYIGVEEQDIQEIQKMNQQIETIILTKGDSQYLLKQRYIWCIPQIKIRY